MRALGWEGETEPLYHHALALYEQVDGTQKYQAHCLHNLATTLHNLGREGETEPLYHHALALYEQVDGTQKYQAHCLHNLATTLHNLGREGETEPLLRRALALYEQIDGTEKDQANCLHDLAITVRRLGRAGEAEPLLRRALALYEQIDGTQEYRAGCLRALAQAVTGEGRLREALDLYRRALALYGALANTHTDQAACLTDLARTTADLEHPHQAETLYQRALALYDTLDDAHEDHARCLQGLADCLSRMGNRTKDAQRALEKALDILDTTPDPDAGPALRLDIECDLALASTRLGEHTRAQLHAQTAHRLAQHTTIAAPTAQWVNTVHAIVLRAQAHATTDPARRRDTLARALDHALPAALYDDERRYQLTSPAKRRAWTHNRAQHSMNQALTLAAELDNAPLLAELVAKWRTTGTLTTTTPTTADPDTLTRAPGPALIMPHPRTTPLHTHPLLHNRPHTHYK